VVVVVGLGTVVVVVVVVGFGAVVVVVDGFGAVVVVVVVGFGAVVVVVDAVVVVVVAVVVVVVVDAKVGLGPDPGVVGAVRWIGGALEPGVAPLLHDAHTSATPPTRVKSASWRRLGRRTSVSYPQTLCSAPRVPAAGGLRLQGRQLTCW